MQKKNNIKIIIFAMIILLTGVGIILYPIVSNCLAEINSSKLINKYIETLEDSTDIEEEYKKAQTYNENLAGDPVHDPFIYGSGYALPENYLEILNINGIMGYVEIPKISLKLPIYHGTSNEVLEKGVGHMQMTSLPVGGISSHSILTGHRGLPSAKLFSDLDKLVEGDIIKIHVLDKTLAYKVYGTEEIKPQDIASLKILPGADLITLVTCTPYGINTHRLLVHASRTEIDEVETEQELENDNERTINKNTNILIIILVLFIVLTISLISIALYFTLIAKRRNNKNNKPDNKKDSKEENKVLPKENEQKEKENKKDEKGEKTNESEIEDKDEKTNESEIEDKDEKTNENEIEDKDEKTNESEIANKDEKTNENEKTNKSKITNNSNKINKRNKTNQNKKKKRNKKKSKNKNKKRKKKK